MPGHRTSLKDRIADLEARKEELQAKLAEAEEPPPLLHPTLAEVNRERVDALSQALGRPDTRKEAGRGYPLAGQRDRARA